jgi:hypothetical protein
MILVAVVILVGVFFVATGRGGELAYEQADHAPLDLGPVSATDVALLRPPTALWGYNMQVTDEALEQIARAVRDRDVTISFLQQRLADLTTRPAEPGDPAGPAGPAQPASLAGPEPSAAVAGPDDHAGAEPGDGALAAEEQSWGASRTLLPTGPEARSPARTGSCAARGA